MPRGIPLDLTGRRYGRWTVVKRSVVKQIKGKAVWDCICECGTKRPVIANNLVRGLSKGCTECGSKNCKGRGTATTENKTV